MREAQSAFKEALAIERDHPAQNPATLFRKLHPTFLAIPYNPMNGTYK
jgi:hypothetical protein